MVDMVELKPGQGLVIKFPDSPCKGEDWFLATFESVCEALTDYTDHDVESKADYENLCFGMRGEQEARLDPVSGQVTYKLPDWLAREKGLTEKVSGVVEQETSRAVLLRIGREPHTDDVWLPKSQITEVVIPGDQTRF